ncbi:hypothetical protein GT360_06125 [Vibrio astriarenae]|uniref:3-oxoacyl-ACP synthase n=1 Tax=Vibrio astriarenae TaxID=1481923 RepID=A0A7Z2T2F6_9VIBR|nr:hypothetical protein [Vibrio astriarenae]QIA63111.1 hypothetical protein GT360_06125 [Vibrio astriarenae]
MKACFPSVPVEAPSSFAAYSKSPVCAWLEHYQSSEFMFSEAQACALSRLLPLLVCGEQSSQWVFYNESRRQKYQSVEATALDDFERIVLDEKYHEQALECVRSQLAESADILSIKRRSQRFFASLGARNKIEEHFAQIACLDALVCKLMLFIEKGHLASQHPFVLLCRAIKQDEARHVSVSKRHALKLGYDKSKWKEMNDVISQQLYDLLNTERAAFSEIGVQIDDVFDLVSA